MAQHKTKTSLAYARLGKTALKHRACDEEKLCEFEQSPMKQPSTASNNIYDAIVGQMAEGHGHYISDLVFTQSKRKLSKVSKENLPKKATWVPNMKDDELLYSTSARNPIISKDSTQFSEVSNMLMGDQWNHTSHRIQRSQRSVSQKPKFFDSGQKSDASGQLYRKNQVITTNFETPRDNRPDSCQSQFLLIIDSYVQQLSAKRQPQGTFCKDEKAQNKWNRKAQAYEKKLKEMQLSHHVQLKKMKRKQGQLKNKVMELEETVSFLNSQLTKQKTEKRKLQDFLQEFKCKMSMLGASRKTVYSDQRIGRYAFESRDDIGSMDQLSEESVCSIQGRRVFEEVRNKIEPGKKTGNFFKIRQEDRQNRLGLESGQSNCQWL